MAQKKNPFADFFAQNDFAKLFDNYKNPAFDLKGLMETQRKNIQAFSQAQQLAFQGLQAVAQRQGEIISQIVEDNSTLAKEMLSEGTPEEKISKNAEIFKDVYERSVSNLKELSEMISKSNNEASNVINKRVAATMNEIQVSLEKSQEKGERAYKKAA
jgi:phasin family protein